MHSTDVLMGEHRIIEGVLGSLETLATRLSRGEHIPAAAFLAAADFIRNFADGHHHQKEEGILFERLIANGMPREMGPVGVMLAEHEEGRGYARGCSRCPSKSFRATSTPRSLTPSRGTPPSTQGSRTPTAGSRRSWRGWRAGSKAAPRGSKSPTRRREPLTDASRAGMLLLAM